ncbi:unnamed protein product [Dibothriocephalus latus]|uniref:Uncharacterized protein n=1 Tax=Dibothriocephalus latus TaxID=60516 RepID=A0A3P7PD51_DIBLA|nr:unnamed protein product [Dibothriocephalus latus]
MCDRNEGKLGGSLQCWWKGGDGGGSRWRVSRDAGSERSGVGGGPRCDRCEGCDREDGVGDQELKLEVGETIDSIQLNSGWLIDRICFITSRRRRVTYGSSSGGGLRQVTRIACCQRYDDPSYSSYDQGELQRPTLALHGFAYSLVSTLGKIAWIDVQFMFSGLNDEAAQLITHPTKVKLTI